MTLFNECFWNVVCFVDDFPPPTPAQDWIKLDLGLVLHFTCRELSYLFIYLFIWSVLKMTTVLSIVIDVIFFNEKLPLFFLGWVDRERGKKINIVREKKTMLGSFSNPINRS